MEDAKQQYDEVLRQGYTWGDSISSSVNLSATIPGSIELHLPVTEDLKHVTQQGRTQHTEPLRLKERKQKRLRATHCSVCTRYIWFDSIHVQEPKGLPKQLSWMLCKECHGDLLTALQSTPKRSLLGLRIAMCQIRLQHSPHIHSTKVHEYISNHRGIIFVAVATSIVLFLQTAFIVMIANTK